MVIFCRKVYPAAGGFAPRSLSQISNALPSLLSMLLNKGIFRTKNFKLGAKPFLAKSWLHAWSQIRQSIYSRIYTGDFFACDFLIKMDLAKLHLLNDGFDHDNWNLTDGNTCLKLVSYQYYYN